MQNILRHYTNLTLEGVCTLLKPLPPLQCCFFRLSGDPNIDFRGRVKKAWICKRLSEFLEKKNEKERPLPVHQIFLKCSVDLYRVLSTFLQHVVTAPCLSGLVYITFSSRKHFFRSKKSEILKFVTIYMKSKQTRKSTKILCWKTLLKKGTFFTLIFRIIKLSWPFSNVVLQSVVFSKISYLQLKT